MPMMIFAVVGMLVVVCAVIIINDNANERDKKYIDIIHDLLNKDNKS